MQVATTALFWGPPGTGKSMAAKAVGFETGRALKLVNCAQLCGESDAGKAVKILFTELDYDNSVCIHDLI